MPNAGRREAHSLATDCRVDLRCGALAPAWDDQGPDGSRTRPFVQKTFAMGRPKVDLDKASALAARLEDEEVVCKQTLCG